LPFIALTASSLSAQPLLKTSTDLATAGYFQLSWNGSDSQNSYQLQQSADASFASPITIYNGTDTASVLSGLSDGAYHYRVLDQKGEASNIITVEVTHHSLNKAFAFFGLGALMFVILVVVLVSASRTKDPS